MRHVAVLDFSFFQTRSFYRGDTEHRAPLKQTCQSDLINCFRDNLVSHSSQHVSQRLGHRESFYHQNPGVHLPFSALISHHIKTFPPSLNLLPLLRLLYTHHPQWWKKRECLQTNELYRHLAGWKTVLRKLCRDGYWWLFTIFFWSDPSLPHFRLATKITRC